MPYFTGYIGPPGSGKTNLLTAEGYKAYCNGDKIVATYHLEFPHTYMSYDNLIKNWNVITNSKILMDELGEAADAYDFLTEEARVIGKMVRQIRKNDNEGIYSVQHYTLIPPRLRRATQAFVLLEDLDAHRDHRVKGFVCAGKFKFEKLDGNLQLVGRGIFDGTKTRHLYNTKERVKVDYVDEREQERHERKIKRQYGG